MGAGGAGVGAGAAIGLDACTAKSSKGINIINAAKQADAKKQKNIFSIKTLPSKILSLKISAITQYVYSKINLEKSPPAYFSFLSKRRCGFYSAYILQKINN